MSKSDLLKKEDYWSIWIGFFILVFGSLLFFTRPPVDLEKRYSDAELQMTKEVEKAGFKTHAYWKWYDKQSSIKGENEPIGQFFKWLTNKPGSWKNNPFASLYQSPNQIKKQKDRAFLKYEEAVTNSMRLESEAIKGNKSAEDAGFENEQLNEEAIAMIESWRDGRKAVNSASKKYNAESFNRIPGLIALGLFLIILFGVGLRFMGKKTGSFPKAFAFVFGLAILSYILAGQATMKEIGFGYAAWAIILGLLISNTIGTPKFAKPALLTEFFIKTGLVLLGAEILFGKILAIGLPGIFVAWFVTPIVLVTTYWFGQKIIKIPSKTLNMTISADMSVCGVSAAVATAAACKAPKEELTLAIGLSMVFTSVMMIVMPTFINWVGMPEILGGAWIGGTIDATGAVVAAGAFLGDDALNVAATIKMIQNILIGLIAFGVAYYFATKVDKTNKVEVGKGEIWKRFPKFILGFIAASIIFSLMYEMVSDAKAYALIDHGVIRGFSKNMRGWLFCLAFVSIGLSTNFKELKKHFKGGKPLLLYVCGQALNLGLTLLMAYIMFYKVFPHITENI